MGPNTGTIAARFTLPNGAKLASVAYHVLGGPSAPLNGTATIGDAQSVEFVVGGLLAGNYTMTLDGVDSIGDHCSTPTATAFAIVAGQTAEATLTLVCQLGDGGFVTSDAGTGSVAIDAGVITQPNPTTVCPGIFNLSADRTEEPVGEVTNVTVTTLPAGAAVSYAATSTDGLGAVSLGMGSGGVEVVTCQAAGQVRLTVSTTAPLADGGLCPPATQSILINCEAVEGPVCPPGQTLCPSPTGCTDLQTDINNCGGCGNVCPLGTVDCIGGICQPCLCCAPQNEPLCNQLLATLSGIPAHTTCTDTELALFFKTPGGRPGNSPATGNCLACAFNGSCLDDNFGDTGLECEDLAGTAQCLADLECEMGIDTTDCGATAISAPSAGISTAAYCGAGESIAQCESPSPGPTGACASQISAAFPAGSTSTFIVNNFSTTTFPGGIAGKLASCLNVNCSSQCFP
jgi:hypothetical protein